MLALLAAVSTETHKAILWFVIAAILAAVAAVVAAVEKAFVLCLLGIAVASIAVGLAAGL